MIRVTGTQAGIMTVTHDDDRDRAAPATRRPQRRTQPSVLVMPSRVTDSPDRPPLEAESLALARLNESRRVPGIRLRYPVHVSRLRPTVTAGITQKPYLYSASAAVSAGRSVTYAHTVARASAAVAPRRGKSIPSDPLYRT
jgi:hypothetical protein